LESKKLKLGELKRRRDELTDEIMQVNNHDRDFLHQQYIRHRRSLHFLKTQIPSAHNQKISFHRTQLQATKKWYLIYIKLSNIDRNIGNVERDITEYMKMLKLRHAHSSSCTISAAM